MRARTIVVGLLLIAGSSQATGRVRGRPNDPFESLNRAGFAAQMTLDRYVVGPLTAVYHALTPGPIGRAIHHFLVNLSEPVVAINDMLQLRPARAAHAVTRLVVNSTLGVGGVLDAAATVGIPNHLSSFVDTLGRYGVRRVPYLFIPMIGPSTVRDLFGNGVDATIDPLHFVRYNYRQNISIGVAVAGASTPTRSRPAICRRCSAGRPIPTPPYARPFCRTAKEKSTARRRRLSIYLTSMKASPQLRPASSRRPSNPCQMKSTGSPTTMSRARLIRERARATSGPRPNRGPSKA